MTPVIEPEPTEETDVESEEESEPATPLSLPLSPVSPDRVRPVAMIATVATALLLLVAALWGYAAMLAVTLVLALVLAASWPALAGSVTPRPSSFVLAVSSVVVVLTSLREDLLWIAAAVALGIVLSFLHQLVRAPGRESLVLSLLAAFGGLLLVASATTMVALSHRAEPEGVVVVGMVAVVAAVLGDLLAGTRGAGPFLSFIALGAAIAAALLTSLLFPTLGALEAAGLGAAVGTVSWSFRRILSAQPAMLATQAQTAAGIGSVFVTGGVVYLFGLIA